MMSNDDLGPPADVPSDDDFVGTNYWDDDEPFDINEPTPEDDHWLTWRCEDCGLSAEFCECEDESEGE
jgi:hypothetical protein